MPDKINLFTEYSPWFFFLCLALGGVFAYLLYEKIYPWTKSVNRLLRIIRFVLITTIAALLIGFMLKQVVGKTEKPVVTFLIDNSESLALVRDTAFLNDKVKKLNETAAELREKGFETEFFAAEKEEGLGEKVERLAFNAKFSDLGKMLKNIQVQYENRNLSRVVFFSDGIHNQGLSPEYQNYGFALHTVGIGDTVQRKDAGIRNVYHNKVAYLGNQFPVSAEIFAYGYAGKNASVSIYREDKLLAVQNVSIKGNSFLQEVNFLLNAEKAGLEQYRIAVQPLEDEFTTNNNSKQIYIEIIDNKEKVLLVAPAPHPDIKAFRSVFEKSENYDFELYIPNLTEKKLSDQYDLIIFMHVPSPQVSEAAVRELMKKSRSHCFIVGGSTLVLPFNRLGTGLNLQVSQTETDKVFPEINPAFERFQFDDEAKKHVGAFTPISVPYGDFNFAAASDVVFYQKVGKITTKKPLLAVTEKEEGIKSGFVIGDGFWQWRLQEFAQYENHHAFDMFFGKFFQYLANKADKSRFRVTTGANEYFMGEPVVFHIEIYDALYEKIIGKKIDLELKGKNFSKSYTFTNSTPDFRYPVEGLDEGIYYFTAKTELDGKEEVVKGKFVVKSTQIEASNVKADFDLLRNLAKKQNGNFYLENELDKLKSDLLAENPVNIARTSEEFDDILRLPYLFFFILLLASFEWFMRKYSGGY
jgi:hypothetical protein